MTCKAFKTELELMEIAFIESYTATKTIESNDTMLPG